MTLFNSFPSVEIVHRRSYESLFFLARFHLFPHVLTEDLFAEFGVATVLIDAVSDVLDIGLRVVELKAIIEGHVPSAFLQLEGYYLEGALWFELESERGGLVLNGGH